MSDINIASILADYFRNDGMKCQKIEALILDDKHAQVVDAVMKEHWNSIIPARLPSEEQAKIWESIKRESRLGKPAEALLRLQIKRYTYSAVAVLVLAIGMYITLFVEVPLSEVTLLPKTTRTLEKPISSSGQAPVSINSVVASPKHSVVAIQKTLVAAPKEAPTVVLEESPVEEAIITEQTPPQVQEEKTRQQEEYITGKGETIEVLLADGSLVRLYEQTRLSVFKEVTDSVREVSLSGRAHFQIAHRVASTFNVSTSNVVVEVLGTKFEARSYETEDESVIRVEQGCVRVSIPDNTRFVLTAHKVLVYDKTTKRVSLLRESTNEKKGKKKSNIN